MAANQLQIPDASVLADNPYQMDDAGDARILCKLWVGGNHLLHQLRHLHARTDVNWPQWHLFFIDVSHRRLNVYALSEQHRAGPCAVSTDSNESRRRVRHDRTRRRGLTHLRRRKLIPKPWKLIPRRTRRSTRSS